MSLAILALGAAGAVGWFVAAWQAWLRHKLEQAVQRQASEDHQVDAAAHSVYTSLRTANATLTRQHEGDIAALAAAQRVASSSQKGWATAARKLQIADQKIHAAVAALQSAPDLNLDYYSKNQVRKLANAMGVAWHVLTFGRYPETAHTPEERAAAGGAHAV